MGIFKNRHIPSSKLKLNHVIPYYDFKMHKVMEIGKHLYAGYLPDGILHEDFKYLRGFHDYKIYTYANREGITKRRKSLNVPKVSTEYLAKLIYTEEVTQNVVTSNEKKQEQLNEYLQEVLEKNNYWSNTKDNAEVMFNIGGAVEKPVYKDGRIQIEFTDGTTFDATDYDNSYVYSGVFTNTFTKDGYYYTKLTRYEKKNDKYILRKELYKSSTSDVIGQKVPYNSVLEDKDYMEFNNFKSIPFTYKKPRIKNNLYLESPYGIPIWWNAIDVIADIDLIFDRKNTEVRYGGRQKVIPMFAMQKTYRKDRDGKLQIDNFYDPDDPTIFGAGFDPEKEGGKPLDLTSDIRTGFIELLNQSLDVFSFMTGFSAGTFTSDGKTIQTATQVITEKMATYQTKVNQEQALKKYHKNLFMSILELASALDLDPRVRNLPDDLDIEILFDDSVIMDKEKEKDDMKNDANEGYIQKWRYTAKKYGMTKEEAIEEIKLAQEDEDNIFMGAINNLEEDGEE